MNTFQYIKLFKRRESLMKRHHRLSMIEAKTTVKKIQKTILRSRILKKIKIINRVLQNAIL